MSIRSVFNRAAKVTLGAAYIVGSAYAGIFGVYATVRHFTDDMEFVTASPTKSVVAKVTESGPSFGPLTEDSAARIAAPQVIDPNQLRGESTSARLSLMPQSHAVLIRNLGTLSAIRELCHSEKDDVRSPLCTKEMAKYERMIETVRTIPDMQTRAMAINAWVNTAIRYDDEEKKSGKRRPLEDVIITGRAVCDEMAQLKYHALRQAGFSQNDIRYVVGVIVKDGEAVNAHALTLVRIHGRDLILNNQQADMPNRANDYAVVGRQLDANSRLTHWSELMSVSPDKKSDQEKFLPKYAMNEEMAAPYAGMVDTDSSPFYVGKPLAIPRIQQVSENSLGEDLGKIGSSVRDRVRATLMDAVNYHAPDTVNDHKTSIGPVSRLNGLSLS